MLFTLLYRQKLQVLHRHSPHFLPFSRTWRRLGLSSLASLRSDRASWALSSRTSDFDGPQKPGRGVVLDAPLFQPPEKLCFALPGLVCVLLEHGDEDFERRA
jgi:hypothetical protein